MLKVLLGPGGGGKAAASESLLRRVKLDTRTKEDTTRQIKDREKEATVHAGGNFKILWRGDEEGLKTLPRVLTLA